ncbi:MAG TPA: DMT family transporter [Phycisphaerales bacterium]|nr:DMT family transporter [Phycisphaerales bacterium]
MKYMVVLLTVAAGALFPLQAGVNARCGQGLGSALWATLISFCGGTLAMAAVVAVARPPIPSAERAAALPWWAWAGGLCGAALVTVSTIAVKDLGYLGLITALLIGQVLASVLFDHTGFLRDHVQPLTLGRGAGLALLAAGFWLVNRS